MRFVVTAGPTREAIDPVRFISNRSSGKMGYAIAEAALARGHEVTLISGPASLAPPPHAKFIPVTSADELHHAVHRAVPTCDVLVMCAAVSDYKPAAAATRKTKKRKSPFALKLIPTRDILASLPKENRRYLVVGFAAETHDLKSNAQKKLRQKNCDIVVANDVSRSDSGMESDANEVVIFFRNGETEKISRASKKIIARELVKKISKCLKKV
ncbi:MAG TPA: bifunctional phosphopantothenoylcysteine decarboxylase/phosphopantothenate--cysteine ligase CoaBC [Chthoniobacterales bacterium]|nr:bifunctional phosphopantothenoylcysteine decarboxylase/phosphopantothenate--cysteine ligase CoaBC [Chthoniobacterales bacterium]